VLHLKQLKALPLLEALRGVGLHFVVTPRIEQELRAMTLAAQLDQWYAEGALQRDSVRARRGGLQALYKKLKRGDPRPGRVDAAAVALTAKRGGVFFTHDRPAALLARRNRVPVCDVVDLALLAVEENAWTWSDAEEALARLDPGRRDAFAARPADWAGSVEATATARPHASRLLQRLQEQLRRPAEE